MVLEIPRRVSIVAMQRAGAEINFTISLEPSGRTAIEPVIAQLEQEGVSVITFDCATRLEELFPEWGGVQPKTRNMDSAKPAVL